MFLALIAQYFSKNLFLLDYFSYFSIEVFDSDKFGKDKSLGSIEVSQRDLMDNEPRWFPLKGAKSGEILLNTELLAPGQSPSGLSGLNEPVSGKTKLYY